MGETCFENFLGEIFFDPCPLKEGGGVRGGKVGDGVREVTGETGMTGMTVVTGVTGVTGVVRLTKGRYPPSYLECLSRQDSENITHC